MKTYGLVLADNGSPWFFQGEQNARWPDRLIEDLKQIPASAFVAVDTSSLKVSDDSAAVAVSPIPARAGPAAVVFTRPGSPLARASGCGAAW